MARVLSLVLLGIDKLSPVLKGVEKNLDKIQGGMNKTAMAGGLVAATGAATQLVAALAPVATAAGALPGAFAMAKVGALTTKVAFDGLSEAMGALAEGDTKKLKKAMEGLAPSAREVVTESGKILKTFEGLKGQVQGNMFVGIAPHMRDVANNLAPSVQVGMSGVASSMNLAGKEALKFGASPVAKGVVTKVFASTERVIRNATDAVQPLLSGLARLVEISLPFSERLAGMAIGGAKAAGAFLNSEAGMTRLSTAIGNGMDRLATLGRIIKNVGSGTINMFRQVSVDGEGLLATIERLTARFSAWARTAEGQRKVAEAVAFLTGTLKQAAQILPILLSPLATVAKLITGMPEPLRSVAMNVLAVGIVFGPLASKVWAVVAAMIAAGKAIVAWNIGSKLAAAASKIWAAGIWLVNAAMRANPIGIVITALVALGAGLVLAYNKSETFRNIVQTAWKGIQAAVSFAWNNVLKPAFTWIHGFIANTLAPIFTWIWKNIITPAWKGIEFAIKVAWGIIKIIFAGIRLYVEKVLAPIFTWIWKNIITPVWKGIELAIKVAWGVIKIIFAGIRLYVEKVLAPIFTWIWKNIITPVWNGISAAISKVWNSGIKPVFELLKKGVSLVGQAFEKAKDFIGKVWDKIRELAMKPVRFIVETVYTKGIKAVWDKVADFVKADHLPAAPKFATGGKINAGTTGRADDVMVRASRGEFIVNARDTAKNLPLLSAINGGLNSAQAKKRMFSGDPGGMLPGFADGGIVGWVKEFARKAKDNFIDGVAGAATGVFNPIKGLIDKTLGTTGIGGSIGGVPKKYMGDFMSWLMSHKSDFEGGVGMKAVQAARGRIGTPYSWGGGGPGGPSRGFAQGANITGFDCSSLMQYAWYKATGKVMPRTTHTQYPWLDKVSDPRPGDLGFPHSGHVFMDSGKGNIIEAPFTGAHVREVSKRPAKWGRPPAAFMRADNGVANLRPGLNVVNNGTGQMESLVSPDHARGITIQEMHLHFADDRDMYAKGKHFADGLTTYTKRAGKGWAKNIGLTP